MTEAKLGSDISEAAVADIEQLVTQVEEGQHALCTGISETNTLTTDLVKTVGIRTFFPYCCPIIEKSRVSTPLRRFEPNSS